MSKPSTHCRYASVILDVAIDKPLDYEIPEALTAQVKRGVRVEVPLRGATQTGYVIDVKDTPDWPKVKLVSRVVSDDELITTDLFDLALWMARYYCSPLRQVFKAMLPAAIRKDTKAKEQLFVVRLKSRAELAEQCVSLRNKSSAQAAVLDVMLQVSGGIFLTELLEATQGSRSAVDALVKKKFLAVDNIVVDRSVLAKEEFFPSKPKILNEEQRAAHAKISTSIEQKRFEVHLLHGITGSGKTEVYLQAIEVALKHNRGCIVLVPEISLTAQTIERFRSRFEGEIAVLHHRLSAGERFDAWHKIRRGQAKIVIGARSAVFSPVADLGLIIVDEEHENAYKQSEEVPCYHARDIAVMRAKLAQGSVILGSATPSLESYRNAHHGKYTLSSLQKRAEVSSLPQVTLVDMKLEFQKAKGFTNFSGPLIDAIKQRLPRGEQVILFLNRRGYHTSLLCSACGKSVRCHQCDVTLTFHKNDEHLICHLCGDKLAPPPKCCPYCRKLDPLKYKGVGTELIEKSLHALFDDVRTLRIDADTTRHKGSHQKLLRAFGTGKADILIGTQMIAKGLHFPMVTLVGVLNSDASLQLPDFRAAETTFQLITQVAGRSGRGSSPGEVIIQTTMPENTTIQHASKQDFEGFYGEEIAAREMFNFPPFCPLAKVAVSTTDDKSARQSAELLRWHIMQGLPQGFEAMAVVANGYAKVKNRFRYQFIVKGPSVYPIGRAFQEAQSKCKLDRDCRVMIDINPTSTFF